MAKKYKGSRFKVFKSEKDAKSFSCLTAESAFQSPRRPSKEDTPVKESLPAGESSPYKAPKPQDLSALRKLIEKGSAEEFRQQVWNNPRFLVSSGDTPALLQEGPRYTAMHVSAIKNKPEICQSILDILEDPQFVSKLYCLSSQTEETTNGRINFLVDLYLNMPDKGCCESPLHMACKYGHDEVVEILAAHPRTDKHRKNKYGETPKDIICSRCNPVQLSLKKRIEDLLQGQFFVPLIRSEDNSAPPMIGQPWSPDLNSSPLDIPQVTSSPRDAARSIKACAGPMSPSEASLFHKRWTTPPSMSQSPEQAKSYFNTKRGDSEKGMERIGRQLAHELHVRWSEYWEFLDKFVDFSSSEGLDILEDYFKKRVWLTFVKDFKDKHGISGEVTELTGFSTPVNQRFGQRNRETGDKPWSCDVNKNDIAGKAQDRVNDEENTLKQMSEKARNESESNKEMRKGCNRKINDVVSPVTNLSQCFAEMKLTDDSLSDKATIDAVDDKEVSKADIDSPESKSAKNKTLDSSPSDGTGEISGHENGGSDSNKVLETEQELSENIKDSEEVYTLAEEARSEKSDESKVPVLERLTSVGSESSASYKTAPDLDDVDYVSLESQLSDTADSTVCFIIEDGHIVDRLRDYLKTYTGNHRLFGDSVIVKFVIQLKDSSAKLGLRANIVSIQDLDTVNDIVVIENVTLSSNEVEISSLEDGQVIQLRRVGEGENEKTPVLAYLAKSTTVPKTKYIHGPQPTREDLNVSRALADVTISPEIHPNVFHWKINLSKFLKDTNYRWQSPAKLKTRLRQTSPAQSPLGKTSPVIPYGSPYHGHHGRWVSSDIRTKLFPSITE